MTASRSQPTIDEVQRALDRVRSGSVDAECDIHECVAALKARVAELEAALEYAEEWCAVARANIGAIDGYDYRSGEEYGLRRAEIEIGKRRAALSHAEPVTRDGER